MKSINWRFITMCFLFTGLNGGKVSASVAEVGLDYCQRLMQEFSAQRLTETRNQALNYSCTLASKPWSANMDVSQTPPIVIRPKALQTDEPLKRVLMLSPKWSGAYDETSATIIEQFTSRGIAAEYIFFNYLGDQQLADTMIKNAERQRADLVFSVGSAATEYLSKSYQFGQVPVVTACSKDPFSIGQVDEQIGMSQHNIAYTSLNISVETQISYLKEKFLKGLGKIAVIYDIANTSSIITQVEPLAAYLEEGEQGIELARIAVDMSSLDETLYRPMESIAKASRFVGDTVFLITGSTELFNVIDYINDFADEVPVLSVTPSHVNEGSKSVFVAIGVSFKTNAKLAADYGIRVLQGTAKTQTLPVGLVTMPDISINFLRKPSYQLKVPIHFFEDSSFIYDYDGKAVRKNGVTVAR